MQRDRRLRQLSPRTLGKQVDCIVVSPCTLDSQVDYIALVAVSTNRLGGECLPNIPERLLSPAPHKLELGFFGKAFAYLHD